MNEARENVDKNVGHLSEREVGFHNKLSAGPEAMKIINALLRKERTKG